MRCVSIRSSSRRSNITCNSRGRALITPELLFVFVIVAAIAGSIGGVFVLFSKVQKIEARITNNETLLKRRDNSRSVREGKKSGSRSQGRPSESPGQSGGVADNAAIKQRLKTAEKHIEKLQSEVQRQRGISGASAPVPTNDPSLDIGPPRRVFQPISVKSDPGVRGEISEKQNLDELAKNYNAMKNSEEGRASFNRRYRQTVRFEVDNASARTAIRNVPAEFVTKTSGNYLAVQLGEGWCVVPSFDAVVNTATYNAGALSDVFDCRGFDQANVSSQAFSVKKPAIFMKADEKWVCIDRGELEFSANG